MLPINEDYFFRIPGVVTMTDIPGLPPPNRGKVCDVYDMDDLMLVVRTDRLSAHDVVLPIGILSKGRVLNGLSAYWFNITRDIIENHLFAGSVDYIVDRIGAAGAVRAGQHRDMLNGRSMLVRRANVYPVECIVRGYLFGSMWSEYKALCEAAGSGAKTVRWKGFELPVGMIQAEKLPEPIFTPSTKAPSGDHDVGISFEEMCEIVGVEVGERIKKASLALYNRGSTMTAERGIIVCDSKFEFGELNERIILVDELITPDSSRFWDAATYEPGRDQPSFDKQPVRDYLSGLPWDRGYPGPVLPDDIVQSTTDRYREAHRRITGYEI